MASLGPPSSVRAPKEVFKIPTALSKCRCGKKKVIVKDGKSFEELVLDTAFTQGVELAVFSTVKLSQAVADFKVLNVLFDQAMFREKRKNSIEEEKGFVVDTNKVVPDPKFFPLFEGFCGSFLRLHPPCEFHTFNQYLQLLEENRFSNIFKEMVYQLDLTAKNVLPDSCSRKKIRRNVFDEYNCINYLEGVEKSLQTKFNELEPAVRLSYLFSSFSILVEIIEKDFALWIERLSCRKTGSKFYRPLIVHLLWKDVRHFDEDAITNKLVVKVFEFYSDCLHNKVSAKHLKIVARLINLISEVVDVIGRHQEANPNDGYQLAADFKNLQYLPKIESGSRAFALSAIENGRRKLSRPVLYHMDDTTVIGSILRRFADKFATALNRCACKEEKECLVLDKAFLLLKPPWLLYLTTSILLKKKISIASLKDTATVILDEEGRAQVSQKQKLRLILLSSAVDTLRILGYKARPEKDQQRTKRIKFEPAFSEEIEDIIFLCISAVYPGK